MTSQQINSLKRKLQEARFQMCFDYPDFAQPLFEMTFVAVRNVRRMSTNGRCVFVNPSWLQKASEYSLEFMLAHQLMHISLGHIDRSQLYQGDRYHLACDIVANSHLRELGYIAEALPGIGKIYHQTFYPVIEGKSLTAEVAFHRVPFDPAALKDKKSYDYLIDSELFWDRKNTGGEAGTVLLTPEEIDPDDLTLTRTGDAANRKLAKGRLKDHPEQVDALPGEDSDDGLKRERPANGEQSDNSELRSTLETLRYIKKASEKSAFEEEQLRVWQRPNDARLDWRKLLDCFLQEEICDYSFMPPDRRMQDSEFFLPDFNETAIEPKEVLFAVDTSGSIDDSMLDTVYAELAGALEQFGNRLQGILAFFDTRVYRPIRFTEIDDLHGIVPMGGGGTDFSCLFSYIDSVGMTPSSIVVFTDGRGEYPEESAAGNVPVLWLLSQEDNAPPWGRNSLLR